MKRIKPKSEYLILGVVIAALLLYLLLHNPDRINYQLPRLAAMAEGDVSAIEIARAGAAVRLEKKDGQWLIQPQGFSADPAKIKAIVNGITGLSMTALVSEYGNYYPYGLDQGNAIVVKAYQGGRLLREFSVGNAASTYNHTYVKLADDPRVYHAGKSFRGDFEQKVDGLRDKTVLQVDKNQITAVEIATAGAKVLFIKHAQPVEVKAGEKSMPGQGGPSAPEESWLMADGKPANPGELNGIIEQTSQLSCEGFIEGKAREDFQGPVYTVTLKGAKDFRLSIFAKAEKEPSYPALSSESPYPFLLSAYKAENIMKKLDVLKNGNPAAK